MLSSTPTGLGEAVTIAELAVAPLEGTLAELEALPAWRSLTVSIIPEPAAPALLAPPGGVAATSTP